MPLPGKNPMAYQDPVKNYTQDCRDVFVAVMNVCRDFKLGTLFVESKLFLEGIRTIVMLIGYTDWSTT